MLGLFQVDGAGTHSMTACNCTKPQYLGVVNLGKYSRFPLEPLKSNFTMVEYTLFDNHTMDRIFRGYACKLWKRRVRVTTFITFSTDTVYYELPLMASRNECWELVRTRPCNGQDMKIDGNVWMYEHPPHPNLKYWDTIQTEVLQCMLEDVSLKQPPQSDSIYTITGKLADQKSDEFALMHGTTFVWPFTTTHPQH